MGAFTTYVPEGTTSWFGSVLVWRVSPSRAAFRNKLKGVLMKWFEIATFTASKVRLRLAECWTEKMDADAAATRVV